MSSANVGEQRVVVEGIHTENAPSKVFSGVAPSKVFTDIPKVKPGAPFRPSTRLMGEMAFQLERRILEYVFRMDVQQKRRFYGYTVSNIVYMIGRESRAPNGIMDVISRAEYTCRLRKLLCALEKYGYDSKVHPDFSQETINKYGLLPSMPDKSIQEEFGLNDPYTINCYIPRLTKCKTERHNLNVILNCLNFMSHCDGRGLFVWGPS